jgi:hypothetical protein
MISNMDLIKKMMNERTENDNFQKMGGVDG